MRKLVKKLSMVLLAMSLTSQLVYPSMALQAKEVSLYQVMSTMNVDESLGKVTIVAAQDAFVHRGSPDKKYGVDDAGRLIVKSPNDGSEPPSNTSRRSYLAFDLSEYDEPYVKKATFKIHLEDKLGTSQKDVVSLYETLAFSENEVTWNHSPEVIGSPINKVEIDKSTLGKYIEVDITDYINTKLIENNGKETIYLGLKMDKEHESDQAGVIFTSKESSRYSRPPIIEIERGMPSPTIITKGLEDESVVEEKVLRCEVEATSLNKPIPVEVKVNEKKVEPTTDNQYELALEAGENIITVSASDSQNNITTKRYRVKCIQDEGALMSFQVISDTHITSSSPSDGRAVALKNALQEMKERDSDSRGVFLLGDNTQDGSEAQYKGLMSILGNKENNPLTYYPAIGNHDVRWLEGGFEEAEERFLRHFNKDKVYYDEWIEGYHFIVLGTEKDLKDDAYISDEQMAWLEAKLQEGAQANKPIFLFVHQPLNVGFYDGDPWNIGERDQEMKHLLAKYSQVIYMSGHLHNPFERDNGPLYKDKYCAMIDVPGFQESGQGYFIDIYEDKVMIKGRDFNKDKWSYKATFDLGLPADIPQSDTIEPIWGNNASLSASADSRGCIDLEWSGASDNEGITEYQILRNGMPYALVDASTTSYKADKLFKNQTYTFTIQARDAEGRCSTNGPSITIKAQRDSVNAGRPSLFDKELVDNMMVYIDFDQNYVDQANQFNPKLRRGKIVYEETPYGYGAKYNKTDSLIIGDIDYGTEDFTVSYWFKGTATDFNSGPTIMSNKRFSNRKNPGWVMAMTNGGKMWYNSAVKINGEKVQVDDQGKSNIVIADQKWHYITVSTDRTNHKVDIYKDGNKEYTHDISVLQDVSFNTQHPTLVGADGEGQNWGAFEFVIDELFMTRKAATKEQAKAMYEAYTLPLTTKETTTLAGNTAGVGGDTLIVTLGIDHTDKLTYAEDILIKYDDHLLDLLDVKEVSSTMIINKEEKEGEVRLLLAHHEGLEAGESAIELEFAMDRVKAPSKAFVEVSGAELGIVADGNSYIVPALGTTHTITINPASETIDKSQLEAAIDKAEKLSQEAVIGDEVGQYPQAAKDALDEAIKVARRVMDTSNNQIEIDKATDALRIAIDTFKEAEVKLSLEDINQDGRLDVADLALVAYYYKVELGDANWEKAKVADTNQDDKVDIIDLTYIASKILGK